MTPLATQHWEDLIGAPFEMGGRGEPGYDCLGLLLEVHRRMGFMVPDPFDYRDGWVTETVTALVTCAARGWDTIPAADAVPGDGVAMDWDGRPHVAVLLPGRRIIHALEGVGVACTRITTEMQIRGYFRPRPTIAVEVESGPGCPPDPADLARGVTVRTIPDVLASEGRSEALEPWSGETVAAHIPAGWEETPELVHILRNGHPVPRERWGEEETAPGDEVIVARAPGVGAALVGAVGSAALGSAGALTTVGTVLATAVNLAVGLGLSFVASLLTAPTASKGGSDDGGSPTYDLSGAGNSIRNGEPIPVVYGEMQTGGQIIQLFNRVDGEGRSVLFMLLALSQGEIDSIAGLNDVDELEGSAIPSSITINGNPASNYKGVRISTRMGTTEQDPIPGFRDVITASTVNVTLDDATPGNEWTQQFGYQTSQTVDAFELNFHMPEGLINYSPNGNPGTRTVAYEVRYRELGAASWTTSGLQAFQAQTRGPISTSYRVDGLAPAVYEIQVERRSGVMTVTGQQGAPHPETDPDKASRFDLQTVNEIVSDDLAYPNVALLAIRAVATDQLSGQIPTVLATIKGKKVWTWDGVSTTSPNYTFAWSDDPAWIAHDILTNGYYGLGQHLRSCDMDLQSFADASTFFATTVNDGRGSTHARGICNVVYDTAEKGWDAANDVLVPFRAGLVHLGRKVKVKVEQEYSAISQLFTPGNIVAGSMEVSYRDPTLAANIVEVQYWNEETNYEPDIQTREDDTSLVTNGDPVRKTTLTLRAVTHPARAARAAQFHLNVERALLQRIRFLAPVDAIVTEPGDVFAFQHDVHNETNVIGGRVVSADAAGTVELDREVNIGAGTHKISVRTSGTGADVIQERTLSTGAGTYAAGTDIHLSAAWDVGDTPTVGDPYCIGPESTYRKLYRCTSVELRQDFSVAIEGVEYDASVYSDDVGTVETFTDSLPDPRKTPTNPTNVHAEAKRIVERDGSVVNACYVTWQGNRDEECDVYVKKRGNNDA